MKAVKFLMPHTVGSLFNEGEIAGFTDEVAEDLIKREIAEPYKGKVKAKGKDETLTNPSRVELEAKTKPELVKIIADEKIEGTDGKNKPELIDAILEARAKA